MFFQSHSLPLTCQFDGLSGTWVQNPLPPAFFVLSASSFHSSNGFLFSVAILWTKSTSYIQIHSSSVLQSAHAKGTLSPLPGLHSACRDGFLLGLSVCWALASSWLPIPLLHLFRGLDGVGVHQEVVEHLFGCRGLLVGLLIHLVPLVYLTIIVFLFRDGLQDSLLSLRIQGSSSVPCLFPWGCGRCYYRLSALPWLTVGRRLHWSGV